MDDMEQWEVALALVLANPKASLEELGRARALVAEGCPEALPAINAVYALAQKLRPLCASARRVQVQKLALKMLVQGLADGAGIDAQTAACSAMDMTGHEVLHVDVPPTPERHIPPEELN